MVLGVVLRFAFIFQGFLIKVSIYCLLTPVSHMLLTCAFNYLLHFDLHFSKHEA